MPACKVMLKCWKKYDNFSYIYFTYLCTFLSGFKFFMRFWGMILYNVSQNFLVLITFLRPIYCVIFLSGELNCHLFSCIFVTVLKEKWMKTSTENFLKCKRVPLESLFFFFLILLNKCSKLFSAILTYYLLFIS